MITWRFWIWINLYYTVYQDVNCNVVSGGDPYMDFCIKKVGICTSAEHLFYVTNRDMNRNCFWCKNINLEQPVQTTSKSVINYGGHEIFSTLQKHL